MWAPPLEQETKIREFNTGLIIQKKKTILEFRRILTLADLGALGIEGTWKPSNPKSSLFFNTISQAYMAI